MIRIKSAIFRSNRCINRIHQGAALPKTSLEQWTALASIVDEGGFAAAAEVLHKSQSAVSYAVARLQEALDMPLLEVDGRKAVLTSHGKTLLKRVRPLLRDLETLEELAQTLKQGWEPELKLVVDVAFPRGPSARDRRGAPKALPEHRDAGVRCRSVRRRGGHHRARAPTSW